MSDWAAFMLAVSIVIFGLSLGSGISEMGSYIRIGLEAVARKVP